MGALAEGPWENECERVTLKGSDGTAVEGIHARPTGMPRAGLVLVPDLMGVRPLFDDLCRRIASHGLAVWAVEPFARCPDRAGLDVEGRMARVRDLVDEHQLGDLERAADRLVVEDDVAEVSVMGFCMGGMYALKAAATGRFDRSVGFYGMLRVPEQWQGPGQRDALDTAADACPTLAVLGGRDPWVPPEHVEQLRAVWAGRSDCEVVVYEEAEHGFVHDPDRPAHRADDAADAWRRALAFLGGS
ncbi:MAG: dienelactone hydrolase family protein [Acidimicrobiia bacterium]|nr:dienelactone hydrolase family protein [Acidimicrobiia bacterium]